MFMIKNKAKGRYYYYLYVYCPFNERGKRPVLALGNSHKALVRLATWEAEKRLPGDLMSQGLKASQIGKWRQEIQKNIPKEMLASCTYKEYNKKRRGLAAPTEALS